MDNNNINPNEFNTKKDFEDFINIHPEIKSITEFKNQYPTLYNRFLRLKLNGILTSDDFPIKTKRPNYNLNLNYKTVEDFQMYINENNIKSSSDFIKINNPLYERMCRLGFAHKVKYLEHTNWRYYDSKEKIQEFIFEKNIMSKSDLKKRYIQVYRAYCKLAKTEDINLVFKNVSFDSSDEAKLYYALRERGIYFNTQKYIGKFRYDLIDPVNKIIVEVHGKHHFDLNMKEELWGDNRDERENDIEKQNMAVSNGFLVFYFTYYISTLEEFGYFEKVYIDVDELANDIRKIKILPYTPPNFEELKIEYSKTISTDEEIRITTSREIGSIEDLNQFIQDNKISSPFILINNYPKYHSKAEKYGWISKIKYYKEDGEIGNIKNYRTFDDFQNFILEFRVPSRYDFKKCYPRIYNKSWRFGFLDKLTYYSEEQDLQEQQ